MLESYEINKFTNVIFSTNNHLSKIYENNAELTVKKFSFDIIKDSCLFFGSSYEGRVYYTTNMLGYKMKLPVIIEESIPIIFFPTKSSRSNTCVWISYNNLLKYAKKDYDSTTLYFRDNSVIDVNIRYNVIDNQIIRCIKLDAFWKQGKKVF